MLCTWQRPFLRRRVATLDVVLGNREISILRCCTLRTLFFINGCTEGLCSKTVVVPDSVAFYSVILDSSEGEFLEKVCRCLAH